VTVRTPTRPQDAASTLTAYLFDREHGRQVEDWAACFGSLGEDQVLWVDVVAPSARVSRGLKTVFGLRAEPSSSTADRTAGLVQEDDYLVVTAVAVSEKQRDIERERVVIDCFVGSNWLLTVHSADVAVIDEFRDTASGDGELGALDAPEFLADLLEWVVGSYLRAFDEIEAELEDFDIEALQRVAAQLSQLPSVGEAPTARPECSRHEAWA
jgi:Mg2+ and Co2+ transporter CorA